MFIHFGMSTFVNKELPSGQDASTVYNPTSLDVDQWIAAARDAGMTYAVLTAKHVAGHCLWPSKHTDYSVATSGNKTDVVEQFVSSCSKYGVKPGFYYCSWDNHHTFGGKTPSDIPWTDVMNRYPRKGEKLAPFTSSLYQNFMTDQLEELLSNYGPFAEIWIDIPGVLGKGYRTFLYQHLARLSPDSVIMMNSGIGTGEDYKVEYAFPSDLIAIERRLPPESGHKKWRTINGANYYMPGEICDYIGRDWFFTKDETPRPIDELFSIYQSARKRGCNLLLNVPPDPSGKIPPMHVETLRQLRKKIDANG
ncbi:alpha-L-fucosidase [bacterium]|nr:alpha-L-fucosidase [bacterium]